MPGFSGQTAVNRSSAPSSHSQPSASQAPPVINRSRAVQPVAPSESSTGSALPPVVPNQQLSATGSSRQPVPSSPYQTFIQKPGIYWGTERMFVVPLPSQTHEALSSASSHTHKLPTATSANRANAATTSSSQSAASSANHWDQDSPSAEIHESCSVISAIHSCRSSKPTRRSVLAAEFGWADSLGVYRSAQVSIRSSCAEAEWGCSTPTRSDLYSVYAASTTAHGAGSSVPAELVSKSSSSAWPCC